MPDSSNMLAAALLAALLASPARAHTWVEEFQGINENGTYTGDRGFSRGYMARTDPGFNGDSNLWMLPSLEARMPDQTVRSRINSSDLLCHPSQRSQNYTNSAYPMLQATPGGYVAAKYLENGHVTLPWNNVGKPLNGGTVMIYGTTSPDLEGEKIVNVLQWNKDGSGGNGKGFLMGQMDYDDGECHQINTCTVSNERQIWFPNNAAPTDDTQIERWCESDIKIPEGTAPGKLTVYWIWDWGTLPGEDCLAPAGKDQYYTNCADWEILPAGGNANAKAAGESSVPKLGQEDPNTRAVRNFASRSAANSWSLITAANWADFSNNKAAATPSPAVNSSFQAYCSSKIIADQQSVAANPAAAAAPAASCATDKYAPTGDAFAAWSASVKAQGPPTTTPAPATGAPAMSTSPPATSAAPSTPLLPTSTPAAASSAPAPAPPAPSLAQSDAGSAVGNVVTVTETQVTVSTLTTYVATPPASAAPTSAASAPAPPLANPANPAASAAEASPPPADPNAAAYPTIFVTSNASAGMIASAAPSGAPYAADTRPDGIGGEHRPHPRRHARQFGE